MEDWEGVDELTKKGAGVESVSSSGVPTTPLQLGLDLHPSTRYNTDNIKLVQGDSKLARVKEFGFDELEKATKNFSPNLLLGEGGSGKVFLGWVDQDTIAPSKHGVGMSVAVKRLNQEGFQGYAEWMDFNAKIGGFGFADYGHATKETKVHTRIVGTYGYLDPECFITGQLSMKSDIYSFGVVLLESIAGRRALNFNPSNDNHNLVEWAIGIQSDEGNVQEIIDPRLEGNYPPQAASECAAVALRCIAVESKDRPSIEEVLQSLEKIYAGSVQVMEGKL
ncbi:hypothetical protein E3N88_22905 [Mikania micrantha]|uniref:Protein kinase domain-containing protein n=1 Tax=Mikania micrantha TaxID=192012 RepID=A0A5N6NC04_9ASTR|nr:hypothetical protein E3N88_22905 [Mikania micrantha]